MTAAEAAVLLHVSPKTVTRWAKLNMIPHTRTLGGHRRFSAETIREIAKKMSAGELEEI